MGKITDFINNITESSKQKKIDSLLNSSDAVVRRAIAQPTAVSNGQGKLMLRPISGKLKKRYAPSRQLAMLGIYPNRFNFSEIYNTMVGENLLSYSIYKYSEAVVRNGFFVKSNNPSVAEYLNKRFTQMNIISHSTLTDLIKDMVSSIMLYGNAFVVKHRQEDASGGKTYTRWDGTKMLPIASLYIEDPRKIVIGDGPANKLRYVRFAEDVAEMNLNMLNPALFMLPRNLLMDDEIPAFFPSLTGRIGSLFKVSSAKQKDYIIYNENEIEHIRYNHVPGEKLSIPPFWSTINDIDSLRKIEENVELLVYQYGHPILHGKIGEENRPGNQDEINLIYHKLEEIEGNGFLITDNRVLLEMIGAEGSAVRVDAYLQYFYRRVLTGLWLSEVSVGVGSTSNRSTANTLDKLSQEKVFELQRLAADTIQSIMIELLLEAGVALDWILKPENLPKLVFHNIDLEGLITKEEHIIQLWQGNCLTIDEMRSELGKAPISESEQSKLFVNLVSIPLKKAGPPAKGTSSSSTSQANKAKQNSGRSTNQYGKKAVKSEPQNK